MDYIIKKKNDSDELMHYGVLGMKWGVRKGQKQAAKQQRKQYKEDMKTLQNYRNKATENAQWLTAYRLEQARLRKSYERTHKKDEKKGVDMSKKTKKTVAKLNAIMKYNTAVIKENRQALAECKTYTSKMIKKYGDKKVKKLETINYNGEQILKRRLTDGDSAVRSFNWDKKSGTFIPTATTYLYY